jgi:DNA-binding MarR family transcriptional regulator
MPNLTASLHPLQELGFSQYEAQAYVALLQQNPLNGYELARLSGVPRANIYHVLTRLEDRGAVLRLDVEEGSRFAPVPPEELFRGMRARLQSRIDLAEQTLCSLKPAEGSQLVWNLTGYTTLLDQAALLAGAARQRLLLALSPEEADTLACSLRETETRNVEITTLCLAGCPHECGSCRGRIYRYHVTPESEKRSLLLVRDADEVLAGEIGPGLSAQGVRTHRRLLVDLAARHIRDSIALSAILLDLGEKLEEQLAPETLEVLDRVGPTGGHIGWLDNIRTLLAGSGGTKY